MGTNRNLSESGEGWEWKRAGGVKLIQKDTGGQREVRVEADMTAASSVDITPERYSVHGYTWQSLSFRAEADSRGVNLSRSGAPAPKRHNDPTLDQDKDEWIDEDGTGHGHTIYSYNYWAIYLDVPVRRSHYNWQTFQHTCIGFPSNHDYSWSPPSDDDTATEHKQDMEFGTPEQGILGWTGGATGPQQKIITYTATDSDGATAESRYELTVHDQFEEKTHNVASRNINVRPHPYSQWITATSNGQDLSVYAEQAYGWDVGVSFSGEAARFMAGVFSIDVSGTRTASTNAGASATIPNVPIGYASYLQVYDAVKVHSGLADHWGVAGYIGEEPYEITEPDTPAAGIQAAPLEWRGEGDPPPTPPQG